MTATGQPAERAVLVLEDGTRYDGRAYGARGRTLGEAVFATGMTGYQETLTDPSYAGQIVVQTAPHIGNTGMNDEDPESGRIWVAGYVVRDPSRVVSNYRATRSLEGELAETGIVGIAGVDTRAITRRLRDAGAMRAGIFSGADAELTADEQLAIVRAAPSMTGLNLSAEVSVTEAVVTPAVGEKIGNLAILDLGVKQSTVDNLAARGFEVHVLPQNVTLDEVLAMHPVAAFYSNGPGDPEASDAHVALLRDLLDRELPFFGICFGNQLLGRALGFGTYKLPFGHRGINQPVLDRSTGKVEITAHNHGFAVDAPLDGPVASPNGYGRVEVSHVGLNDQVVEGLRALDIPAFSVQYHPEAAAGPHDANYLFDRFRDMVLETRRASIETRGLSSARRARIETLGLSSARRARIETLPASNPDEGFDTRPPSAGATQPAGPDRGFDTPPSAATQPKGFDTRPPSAGATQPAGPDRGFDTPPSAATQPKGFDTPPSAATQPADGGDG